MKNFIIIEDDTIAIELISMVVGRALKALGFETTVCRSLAEVRERFSGGFPKDAIIVTDGNLPLEYGMPSMGKITETMHLWDANAKERTVVTTSDESIRNVMRANGFIHHLRKSDTRSILAWAQERALGMAA